MEANSFTTFDLVRGVGFSESSEMVWTSVN